MRLDVGCGCNPRGDVNVDRYIEEYGARGRIDTHATPNFVKADVDHLPFRNNVFDSVLSSHVLEHMKHPWKTLEEWKRVASKRVVIAVPMLNLNCLLTSEHEYHFYTWSASSLENLMNKLFHSVHVFFNPRPVYWQKKGFLPPIINFFIRRLLWRIKYLQMAELIAVGDI